MLPLYEVVCCEWFLWVPWVIAPREGERYRGCHRFATRHQEGVQGVVRWFYPYQLCDLGKGASRLCAPNLLTYKTRITIRSDYSCCAIRMETGQRALPCL